MRHPSVFACVCLLAIVSAAGAPKADAISEDAAVAVESSTTGAEQRIPTPVAKPVVEREICDRLVESAQSNDLPIPFFIRLLWQESGFKPDVVSRAGAQGIAQFMPETAAAVGLDNPFDPLQAIAASARLLRTLVAKFGNLGLAAAAYNAGPGRIQNWLARKSKLPQETQHYVKTITGRPAETWKGRKAPDPMHSLPRQAPCREDAGVIALDVPQGTPPGCGLVARAGAFRREESSKDRGSPGVGAGGQNRGESG